ncbi:MAG TPA: L-2-hydroxyglutarate oxidase [Bacteroidetes bacterium]|nr:L-2-hydroxyglutarate oxidase [Bacteroidota bacterium]
MKQNDIAIIGGGIVGMATAMALTQQSNRSVIVIEAEKKLAAHQTGHNSGVIHSGLYYKPGSLKAKNCVTGREMLYRFCAEHGIAHDRCGKLVVATREDELPALAELERRGRENGLADLKKLSADELKEYEPHVSGIAGLHVPVTGIVDYIEVTEKYAQIMQQSGGEIRKNSKFLGLQKEPGGLVLETNDAEIHCKNLINCGGLQSDRIARACNVYPAVRIVPFRGEYYELKPEKHYLIHHLIYPVPDPRFPFLGVHFTRMIHGGREAGPNAVLAFKREGYRKSGFYLPDTLSVFSYPGFWSMAAKYWKMGMGEFYRSFSKRAFVRALQRLIPEIQSEDIVPAAAGVRAQAVASRGGLVDDFRIVTAEHMIHVLNAPSPAATASIAIGQTIADKAQKTFFDPD